MNERIYERRWAAGRRVLQLRPHLWRDLARSVDGQRLLEIGPGLRPTIPVDGSFFVDISPSALRALASGGGRVALAAGSPLPFRNGSFGGVFAFEVLEHVQDDAGLLSEIARVVRPGGTFVLSVPLHMSQWTRLDDISAHVRRYEPGSLLRLIEEHGFRVERYEYSAKKARPRAANVKASIFEAAPRVTDAIVHALYFPLLAAVQRRSGRVSWSRTGTPVPPEASGITVLARRARPARHSG